MGNNGELRHPKLKLYYISHARAIFGIEFQAG